MTLYAKAMARVNDLMLNAQYHVMREHPALYATDAELRAAVECAGDEGFDRLEHRMSVNGSYYCDAACGVVGVVDDVVEI